MELYRQALQRLEGFPFAKKALGHLHLNLANNYFILTNFKEAGKHYRKVLAAFDAQESYSFENQKQEILFYFNFRQDFNVRCYAQQSHCLFEKMLRAL